MTLQVLAPRLSASKTQRAAGAIGQHAVEHQGGASVWICAGAGGDLLGGRLGHRRIGGGPDASDFGRRRRRRCRRGRRGRRIGHRLGCRCDLGFGLGFRPCRCRQGRSRRRLLRCRLGCGLGCGDAGPRYTERSKTQEQHGMTPRVANAAARGGSVTSTPGCVRSLRCAEASRKHRAAAGSVEAGWLVS